MTDTPPRIDLTTCDREPIHIPGAIQPHGVLLALNEPDLVIVQASENVLDHLGDRVEDVVGQPLSVILDPQLVEKVRSVLIEERWNELNPLPIDARGKRFDGIVHRHDGMAILELEPVSAVSSAPGLHHPLRPTLMRLQFARSVLEVAALVVDEVRHLTGYDRVMFYRFHEDGHGSVDAESIAPGVEPYLGLHYPASDIPHQARQLYLKNWLRIIVDARYEPSRLVPPLRPDTGRSLDLSFAVLRSVSPIHLEYMANMGARASMSISLVVDDRLWGLISCVDHAGPRHVAHEMRASLEFLGRLVSLQVDALDDRAKAASRASRQASARTLSAAMRAGDGANGDANDEMLTRLFAQPVELLELVDAEGAALVGGGEVSTAGRAPPSALIREIAAWLEQRGDLGLFSTDSLATALPAAMEAKDVAAGLLTFALPGVPQRRLLWFRPEIIRTVSWGGDPRQSVKLDPSMPPQPRRSFALWKEEVRLRARGWSDVDLDAAAQLRRDAVEVDLERAVSAAQRAVAARDEIVAVVSHDLRNPLSVIHMDATILQTVHPAADEERARQWQAAAARIE